MSIYTSPQDITQDLELDPSQGTWTPKIRTPDCVVDPVLWNSVLAFEIDDSLKRGEDLDNLI